MTANGFRLEELADTQAYLEFARSRLNQVLADPDIPNPSARVEAAFQAYIGLLAHNPDTLPMAVNLGKAICEDEDRGFKIVSIEEAEDFVDSFYWNSPGYVHEAGDRVVENP